MVLGWCWWCLGGVGGDVGGVGVVLGWCWGGNGVEVVLVGLRWDVVEVELGWC